VASVLGIQTVKQFTYRGDPTEEWSNTYHFTAPPPTNDADWLQVVDALMRNEILHMPSSSKIVRAYGYNDDADPGFAVYTLDLTATGDERVGTFLPGGSEYKMSGDQAAMIWNKTDHRNARGKHVYLRKYFHDGFVSSTNPDNLGGPYAAVLQNFTTALVTGAIPELGRWRAKKYDAGSLALGVDPYATTRTLKRRGKRPPSPA
jgi:hypothetical protein